MFKIALKTSAVSITVTVDNAIDDRQVLPGSADLAISTVAAIAQIKPRDSINTAKVIRDSITAATAPSATGPSFTWLVSRQRDTRAMAIINIDSSIGKYPGPMALNDPISRLRE